MRNFCNKTSNINFLWIFILFYQYLYSINNIFIIDIQKRKKLNEKAGVQNKHRRINIGRSKNSNYHEQNNNSSSQGQHKYGREKVQEKMIIIRKIWTTEKMPTEWHNYKYPRIWRISMWFCARQVVNDLQDTQWN